MGVKKTVRTLPDDLETAKARARQVIDEAAERVRARVVTPGAGQAMVYERKAQEAEALQEDPDPQSADYPILAASVGIEGATLADVAAVVIARRDAWRALAGQVEAVRLTAKQAVDAVEPGAGAVAAVAAVLKDLAWPPVD